MCRRNLAEARSWPSPIFARPSNSSPGTRTRTSGWGRAAQGQSGRPSAPGPRQIAGAQSQPPLGQAGIGQNTGQMKPLAIAGACLALSLLTYFQFPGHTWLQQDSQIYAPILEHLRDPSVLRNEILAERAHVAYTLYDEIARALRAATNLDFRDVLACEQIVTRAFGIWGLYRSKKRRVGKDCRAR